MMRAAGSQAQLMAKDAGYAQLKMPSGEIRLVPEACMATLGQVSNTDHNTITLGKAGRNRHRGIRPTVRGGAMNATDHPMGGGRGKSKGGNHPKSPWNQLAKGYKTRSKKKVWGWMIVSDRRRAKQLAS
jgi:large subunit ribosomal protein L2